MRRTVRLRHECKRTKGLNVEREVFFVLDEVVYLKPRMNAADGTFGFKVLLSGG